MRLRIVIAAILLTIAAASLSVAQDSNTLLPGGANALSETHGDWRVNCQVVARESASERQCVLTQRQVNQQGQNVLAVELVPGADGLSGAMVLPFGLAVAQPVRLAVDDAEPIALSFSTCLPAGCVVPIEAASTMLDDMRIGTGMTITAQRTDGLPLELPVSLSGLSAAMNRITDLTAN